MSRGVAMLLLMIVITKCMLLSKRIKLIRPHFTPFPVISQRGVSHVHSIGNGRPAQRRSGRFRTVVQRTDFGGNVLQYATSGAYGAGETLHKSIGQR